MKPKSFQNPSKTLQNPYQKPPKKANVRQTDFYCDFFQFFQFFGEVLEAIWPPKCDENQSKIEFAKTSVFQIEFDAILNRLNCQNAPPKRTCSSSFLKTPMLQKWCSRVGGNTIFWVRSLPKSMKNFTKKVWKQVYEKISQNPIFGVILPPESPSKCTPKRVRDASERHLEKKLMDRAGYQRKSTTNQAHAASTRLCIYQVIWLVLLYLCLSVCLSVRVGGCDNGQCRSNVSYR